MRHYPLSFSNDRTRTGNSKTKTALKLFTRYRVPHASALFRSIPQLASQSASQLGRQAGRQAGSKQGAKTRRISKRKDWPSRSQTSKLVHMHNHPAIQPSSQPKVDVDYSNEMVTLIMIMIEWPNLSRSLTQKSSLIHLC